MKVTRFQRDMLTSTFVSADGSRLKGQRSVEALGITIQSLAKKGLITAEPAAGFRRYSVALTDAGWEALVGDGE